MTNKFLQYYKLLEGSYKKLTRLEFLQPDDSVAFALDNNYSSKRNAFRDSRAFAQGGSLNVSLKNGQRRSATVSLSNLDEAFSFSVNRIWFGNRVRLSMGMVLPDGSEFYLPQGVFYLKGPRATNTPTTKSITYNLVDKWSYLDGTLFGTLPYAFEMQEGENIFSFVSDLLLLDKRQMQQGVAASNNSEGAIDGTTPIFTNYYDTLPDISYTYLNADGTIEQKTAKRTDIAYNSSFPVGTKIADLILEANNSLVGWVGYDQTGALRIDASQIDLNDSAKPILYSFSPNNCSFLGSTETVKDAETYNDIIITAKGINNEIVWGRATNKDPSSDTNVNLIGFKTYIEDRPDLVSAVQCKEYAAWMLKRKTVTQKSIAIECSQMFHLVENGIVSIVRTDKKGAPKENHLIQSFTIPIGETGKMVINATSVNDLQSLYSEQQSSDDVN